MDITSDRTLEVFSIISQEHSKLGEDGILVMEYSGNSRNHSLYTLFDWYISYENGRGKYRFDSMWFSHCELIKMLNSNGIEYINNHISMEEILAKMSFSKEFPMRRNIETVSKFYIADEVHEKLKVRKLKDELL